MGNLPKLVIILSRFPYPLEKGDKLRSYYQIKELSKRYSIFLIALSDESVDENSQKELKKYCKSVEIFSLSKLSIFFNAGIALLGTKPIQVGYFYNYIIDRKIQKLLNEWQPDHIFSQLIRTTEYVKNFHNCPKTLDYMDALSKGMERRIENAPWYNKWFFKMEHRRLRLYERKIFDYFDQKIIISEQDKQFIFHPEREEIRCIPNGIDEHFLQVIEKPKDYDFAFVGNMNYPPNIEAVEYIAHHILPSFPNAKLVIAGATPHARVEKLAKSNKSIHLTGWMDDIREAYASAKIFLAPMQTGTGMQNKLLEAMALGIPCVTTPLANNAIGAVHQESIIVADSPGAIITNIQSLLQDSDLRKSIGESGKDFVKNNYSWANSVKDLF